MYEYSQLFYYKIKTSFLKEIAFLYEIINTKTFYKKI